jgi:hypothetical protein
LPIERIEIMKANKAIFGFVALLFCGSAFAQFTDATAPIAGATVDNLTCDPLGAQVSLNLSSGVVGALHCRSVFADAIVGTCHVTGNVTPTTVTCGCGPNTGTPLAPVFNANVSTCPGVCNQTSGTYTTSQPGVADTVLVAGRKAFGASTAGGTVATYSLGDTGTCTDGNLAGISLFP